jgi:integrase
VGYEKTATPGVYKRGSSWAVAARDPITRKVRFHSAPTYKDAKALKRRLEEQREQGRSTPDGRLLFSELWTAFDNQHISTLSPSTAADYRSIANRHLLPRYRLARVADIDTAEVLRFREELSRTKSSTTGKVLSPKRVKNVMVCLQSVYSFGQSTNRAWSNPVQGLRRGGRPQVNESRAVILSDEEASEFLGSVKAVNPAYYPLFLTLLQTGMRLGEALALEARNISLSTRRISITRSVYRGGQLKSPKNGKGRVVGISDTLYEVLLEHLDGKEGLAFASRSGGFIDATGLRRYVFDRAVQQSDLSENLKANLRIHDLRGSYASALARNGVDWRTIMELCGWSSTSVMLRYVHADSDQAAKVSAEAISSLGA